MKAGFGQIHRSRLAKPFKKALHEYTLPNGNVVTESRTESILQAFKDDLPSRFGRVHDEASEDDWPNKWPRPSLMDNARTPVTGTFLDSRNASLMQLRNAKMTDGKAFGEYSCCRAKSFCLPKTAHILNKEVIYRSPEYFKAILVRAADASDVVESGSFASEDRLLMLLLCPPASAPALAIALQVVANSAHHQTSSIKFRLSMLRIQ